MAKTTHKALLNNLLCGFFLVHSLLVVPAFADQANLFVYHRFNDSRYPSTNTFSEDFRLHLEFLSQENFNVLTIGEVVDKLEQGVKLPHRCAVISVDDAYRSFLTEAWPLLKYYGFRATLFVSTDMVGAGDYLSWQELKALQASGVEIGNHSASHDYLLDRFASEEDTAWEKRVMNDLRRSQQAFDDHLGSSARLFAYPYGEFSPELITMVKSAGFRAAVGQQSGVVTSGSDLFSLPRFPMGGQYVSLDEFKKKLFMKSLPIQVVSPQSTLVQEDNPPRLRFYLGQDNIDHSSLRCYVSGKADCLLRKVDGDLGLYEVEATQPISGRRGKYTLTAMELDDSSWCWFSQLWVRPKGGEMSGSSAPR